MVDHLGPYLLGPNDTLENGIYTGDARELAKAIPDESVDLVFTDPVYDRIDDYRWLAECAARVLKQDRACLAMVDSRNSGLAEMAMREALTFEWRLYYTIPGKPGALHLYGVYPCTTVCLLFAKGHAKASPYIPDTIVSSARPDNGFRWQKNLGIVQRWIESFGRTNHIALDPFVGSGTTAAVCKWLRRSWLTFEIDPATADLARERVRNTQPPLFVPEPEQLAMEAIR